MNDSMDVLEILNRIKSPNVQESGDNNTLYQYTPVSTEYVMKNPEQYIIPECLDCCKLLWSKGIDTYQCGNYDDCDLNGFWVEIDSYSLSNENMNLLRELSIVDNRVFFSEGLQGQHNFIIRVAKNSFNPSLELCDIADNLVLQDTNLYSNIEDLLDQYKRVDGECVVDRYGNVSFDINPERAGATIDDVLNSIEHPELYVASEGRLYKNQHALNVHMNYLSQIEKRNGRHM